MDSCFFSVVFAAACKGRRLGDGSPAFPSLVAVTFHIPSADVLVKGRGGVPLDGAVLVTAVTPKAASLTFGRFGGGGC